MKILKTIVILGTVFMGCCVACGVVMQKVNSELDNLHFDDSTKCEK